MFQQNVHNWRELGSAVSVLVLHRTIHVCFSEPQTDDALNWQWLPTWKHVHRLNGDKTTFGKSKAIYSNF